jgi:prevent-host-death family protein
MTRVIAHRELRNNSSAVLRDVEAGETIEVTNHGTVVAVLVPPSSSASSASSAASAVRQRPATRSGGFAALPRVRLDQPVQEVLDDLRGDR